MTDKQREQRLTLLKNQLTLAVWFEKEFRKKLGEEGYQEFIDTKLDEINKLTARKNDSPPPPFKFD